MRIITDITELHPEIKTAVAIGKFDGLHIGHRYLLEEILKQKDRGLSACVFTFHPSPAVLFGQSDGRELMTQAQKRQMFESMGVDILVEFPLTRETASIEPQAFVEDILVRCLHTRFIAAGEDVSFGRYGAGNAALLRQLAPVYGYEVQTIKKVMYEGEEVSSTRIRKLVEAGELEQAEVLLGMPYSLSGKVVHGNRIGHTLGFPTVNLRPEPDKLLPPNGVYFSEVKVGDVLYKAITNIGCKPTVSDEAGMGAESFLYDFDAEIYEEEITVYLKAFKRFEQKFDGMDRLREVLQEDIRDGAKWHGL